MPTCQSFAGSCWFTAAVTVARLLSANHDPARLGLAQMLGMEAAARRAGLSHVDGTAHDQQHRFPLR